MRLIVLGRKWTTREVHKMKFLLMMAVILVDLITIANISVGKERRSCRLLNDLI
jgi:hypothetical protein